MCEQSEIVPYIHLPNILAWKHILDEQREVYTPEQWERFNLLDYAATEAVLSTFSDEELKHHITKAKDPRRLQFIRQEVINSQRTRKRIEMDN